MAAACYCLFLLEGLSKLQHEIRVSEIDGLVCPDVKFGSCFGSLEFPPTEKFRDAQIWGHSSGLFLALIEIVAELNLERYNWFSQIEHSPGSWATEAVGYGRANNLLQVFPFLFGDFIACRRCCPGDWMPLTKRCYRAKCRFPYTTSTQFTWSLVLRIEGFIWACRWRQVTKTINPEFEGERERWTALILWQLDWAPSKMHHCCLSSPDSLLLSQ